MLKFAIAAVLIGFSAEAQAEIVNLNFSGAFGADAYGYYKPGDKITGNVLYDRQFTPDGGLAYGAISIGYTTSREAYVSPVLYASYDSFTKTASFSGARSIPIFTASFTGLNSQFGYLPTLSEFAGQLGSFYLSDAEGRPDGEPFFSGGTGTITVEGIGAVPEPASWAMMIVGIGMTGFVFRRRRSALDVKLMAKTRGITSGGSD